MVRQMNVVHLFDNEDNDNDTRAIALSIQLYIHCKLLTKTRKKQLT